MIFTIRTVTVALALFAALAGGCGGSSTSQPVALLPAPNFWAVDMATGASYGITATKVGEGTHCYVYLERGRSVSAFVVSSIVNEFDTIIYLNDTSTFGSEPNPGIDKDPKVYIVLLDIRDSFAGSGAYVAGYFDASNEYPVSAAPNSNQKEALFMDVFPGTPGSSTFFMVLAHEFQHMIHWNQEQLHKGGLTDDTWLDEAMAEIAPVYCGYGPSYDRVLTFENDPANSLTGWQDTLADYGAAYLWSQYFKDRFSGASPNIFKRILTQSGVGIASVNQALGQITSSFTFTTTFSDWGIALYSGNSRTWAGHPEWSYTSIDTWPGSHTSQGTSYTLPGLFTSATSSLASFATPSFTGFGFYSYAPLSGPTGTVRWTAAAPGAEQAVLIDPLPTIQTGLVSGQAYTFTTTGYLIVSNPATAGSGSDTVTRTALFESLAAIEQSSLSDTLPAMLGKANRDPQVLQLAEQTGEPVPLCVQRHLREKERKLKAQGAKPGVVIGGMQ